MIYLPHPQFDFEESSGGGIVGYANSNEISPLSHIEPWNIDPDKVNSKFEKARSGYWEGRYFPSPDACYCFLREDGNEFAIRFLGNKKVDILGYFIISGQAGYPGTWSCFNEFKIWIEVQCPR